MGGLFAALLLRRLGWDVHVFERVGSELAGRGAGIVTHPVLDQAMRRCGIEDLRELGVPIRARRIYDREGRVVAEHARPQIATSWDRLFGLLRGAFPDTNYHSGRQLTGIEESGGGTRVTARFTDGRAEEGDLLVAADGFRSTARALLLPGTTPRYAGYVGWRGLLREADMPPALHAEIFARFIFYLPPGEQIIGYPVSGPGNDLRPGHRRYNFVWYRPTSEAEGLPRLLTDDTGKRHQMSIPPPLISRAALEGLRADAERLLPPQFAQMLRLCPQPFLQPIYDLITPRMAVGRVALLGDAAFIARPHVGAGVSKAAQDAMALVDALEAAGDDVPRGLAAYEKARHPVNARIVRHAQQLGTCMTYEGMGEEERRMQAHTRDPAVVLAGTAVLDFLEA
jgi:2-polyprenyl-6-methoxyphenol hydroxylase-like FAD-dependent oxidoreductase